MSGGYAILLPDKRHLWIAISVIMATFWAGCVNSTREITERKLNDSIGNSVAGTYFESSSYIERIDQGHVIQYLQRSKLTGCDIAFFVDKQSKRILSWRYLSSPDKCWSGKGSY